MIDIWIRNKLAQHLFLSMDMTLHANELDHLAKLSKLHLSPAEKEQFTQSLDQIIGFLGQLDQIKTEKNLNSDDGEKLRTFEDGMSFPDPKTLFGNSKHHKGDFIVVKTSLKA